MGDEVRLWKVGPEEQLAEIPRARLDLESRLEEWLQRDISILDPMLLVIGNSSPSSTRTGYAPTLDDRDWSGFAGFIASRDEVDQLARALRQAGQRNDTA